MISARPLSVPLSSIVLALGLVSCQAGDPPAELHIEPGVSLSLATYRAAVVSNLSYRLKLDIPAEQDAEIGSELDIHFELSDTSTPLQLDFREDGQKIRRVVVNGEGCDYVFENEHLVIPSSALQLGTNRVEIEHVAGDSSLNRNPDYLYTLFVPDRARTAFPLFDQPNLKATYTLTLTVPADWTALANAPLETVDSEAGEAGRKTFRFATSDLIPSYLFSFVAGRFESVTRSIGGRSMTLLHRETDDAKVTRNLDAIFKLHAASLDWLEEYTGIPYPFEKFDVALIPSFQYGGMEHVGAIQYRASSLLLDEAPSDTQLLGRAGLIAHETAHMWFGNLVTMDWFNDVWTKEVFANFMAAKIVNPSFPEIDHDLNFLVRHYPAAYGVDRSEGANAIRQDLANLAQAGQLYGAIIYNKAPVMMRQLELLVGEQPFRAGIQEYLTEHSFANATWPDLIRILDAKTDSDLATWSEVWVNTPGRPTFDAAPVSSSSAAASPETDVFELKQLDPSGADRIWPQRFSIRAADLPDSTTSVLSAAARTRIESAMPRAERLFNTDGLGYGLFPAELTALHAWPSMSSVEKGSLLINLYENLLDGRGVRPDDYFEALLNVLASEQDQLLLNLAINQATRIYNNFLSPEFRANRAEALENQLWQTVLDQKDASRAKIFFNAFSSLASSSPGIAKVLAVFEGELALEHLKLSENDDIDLAEILAIRLPDNADAIIQAQLAKTKNPDSRRRLEFIAPSLSADPTVRDAFFASLADEAMRETERWVLDALANLHHPSRVEHSESYILPSLELLQEIQVTGDIFFPKRWLDETLQNHHTAGAADTVREFLAQRPDYNPQLRMKILQAADLLFRAGKVGE